jgi:signal peptidase I
LVWGVIVVAGTCAASAYELRSQPEAAPPAANPQLITYLIAGACMEPTLQPGDRVVIDTADRTPRRGQIVVFLARSSGTSCLAVTPGCPGPYPCLIKRVIALGGETIEIRHGVVFIDGRRLGEPYLNPVKDVRGFPPTRVPPGHVFVMGDNRTNSDDSRFGLGPVPECDILGTVVGVERPSP